MNVNGIYTFKIPITTMFINTILEVHGHNIITIPGEAFFLYRCISNDLINELGTVAIGNGTAPPKRTDRRLGNETARKKATTTVNPSTKQIVLNCNFTAEEIQDTTEIGVLTTNKEGGDVLISHDIYNQIDSSVIAGVTGNIVIEYIYQFTTSFQKTNWAVYDEAKNIYYSYEENKIIRVFENSDGYKKVGSLNELELIEGAFYQDLEDKFLYIKPLSDLSTSDIIVQV